MRPRTHLFSVEFFAFDFAGLDHFFGQGLKDGLVPKREAKSLHPANQAALPVTDGSQLGGEVFVAPFEVRPVLELMNIHPNHRVSCGDYGM